MSDNANKNANQNQRAPQSDMNKPQKPGGAVEKQVGNTGTGVQDPNKNLNKKPDASKPMPDTDAGPGTRQTSSNPNKLDEDKTKDVTKDIDTDGRATQRQQRTGGIDRDDQK